VAAQTFPRGYMANGGAPAPAGGNGAGGNVAAPGVVNNAAVTLTVTAFPAAGAISPISGQYAGLGNPAGYKVVMYLTVDGQAQYIKPYPGSSAPLGGDGSFRFDVW